MYGPARTILIRCLYYILYIRLFLQCFSSSFAFFSFRGVPIPNCYRGATSSMSSHLELHAELIFSLSKHLNIVKTV